MGIDIVAAIEERHVAGLLAAFPHEELYISEKMIREAIRPLPFTSRSWIPRMAAISRCCPPSGQRFREATRLYRVGHALMITEECLANFGGPLYVLAHQGEGIGEKNRGKGTSQFLFGGMGRLS
jgi:hypothetical protein